MRRRQMSCGRSTSSRCEATCPLPFLSHICGRSTSSRCEATCPLPFPHTGARPLVPSLSHIQVRSHHPTPLLPLAGGKRKPAPHTLSLPVPTGHVDQRRHPRRLSRPAVVRRGGVRRQQGAPHRTEPSPHRTGHRTEPSPHRGDTAPNRHRTEPSPHRTGHRTEPPPHRTATAPNRHVGSSPAGLVLTWARAPQGRTSPQL
jgi:hypothetical protein